MLPACPSEEILAAFVDGKLSAQELSEVEFHILTCPLCRSVLEKVRNSKNNVISEDSNNSAAT